MYPFIYDCERSIQVYEQSLKFLESSGHKDRVSELGWAYHSIGDLIPQTTESFWSGHFFPWTESWDEIQISFNLCLFGLYKQAMVSLRSGLEVGLLSVYWNLNDDGHQVIQEWLSSEERTPRRGEIWERLGQHRNFQLFQQRHDMRARLSNLDYLHNYVHTKGYKYSNSLGLLKSNFQTFEIEGFETWFSGFREVIEVLSILHLVKYPIGTVRYDYSAKFGIDIPMFGGLQPSQVDRLGKVVGEDVFREIEAIAQTDETVKDILDWVSSLPDMTEEQVESQVIEFEKGRIEREGLDNWLAQEKAVLGAVPEPANGERWQRRIEYLTNWARERGYEKPLSERLQGQA